MCLFFIYLLYSVTFNLEIHRPSVDLNSYMVPRKHKPTISLKKIILPLILFHDHTMAQGNICNQLQGNGTRWLLNPNNFTVYNATVNNRDFCNQVVNFPSPLGYFFYYEEFFQLTNTSILSIKPWQDNPKITCSSLETFTQDTPYNQFIDYYNNKAGQFCSCKTFCQGLVDNNYYYGMADLKWSLNWAQGCKMDPFLLINYRNIENLMDTYAIQDEFKKNSFFFQNIISNSTQSPQQFPCQAYVEGEKSIRQYHNVYNNLHHHNVQQFFFNCHKDLTVLALYQWQQTYKKQGRARFTSIVNQLGQSFSAFFNFIGRGIGGLFSSPRKMSSFIAPWSMVSYEPTPLDGLVVFSCNEFFNNYSMGFNGSWEYYNSSHSSNVFTNNWTVTVHLTTLVRPNYFQIYMDNHTQVVEGKLDQGSLSFFDKRYTSVLTPQGLQWYLPINTTINTHGFLVNQRRITIKDDFFLMFNDESFMINGKENLFNHGIIHGIAPLQSWHRENFNDLYKKIKQKVMVEYFASLLSMEKNILSSVPWVDLMDRLYEENSNHNGDNYDRIAQYFFNKTYGSLANETEVLGFHIHGTIQGIQGKSMVESINDCFLYPHLLLNTIINEKIIPKNWCDHGHLSPYFLPQFQNLNYTEALNWAVTSQKILATIGLADVFTAHDYVVMDNQLVDLLLQHLLWTINCKNITISLVTATDFYDFFHHVFVIPLWNSPLNGKIIVLDNKINNGIFTLKDTIPTEPVKLPNFTDHRPIIDLKNFKATLLQRMDNWVHAIQLKENNIVLWSYGLFHGYQWLKEVPHIFHYNATSNNGEFIHWINGLFMEIHGKNSHNYHNISTEYGLLSNYTVNLFMAIQEPLSMEQMVSKIMDSMGFYHNFFPSVAFKNLWLHWIWIQQCLENNHCLQWQQLPHLHGNFIKAVENYWKIYGENLRENPWPWINFIKDFLIQQNLFKIHIRNDSMFLQYYNGFSWIHLDNDKFSLYLSKTLWIKKLCNSIYFFCTNPWISLNLENYRQIQREDAIKSFFLGSLLISQGLKIIAFAASLYLCCGKNVNGVVRIKNFIGSLETFYLMSSWVNGVVLGFLLEQWHQSDDYIPWLVVASFLIYSDVLFSVIYGGQPKKKQHLMELPAIQISVIFFCIWIWLFFTLD